MPRPIRLPGSSGGGAPGGGPGGGAAGGSCAVCVGQSPVRELISNPTEKRCGRANGYAPRQERRPPRSWCARKKFSLPAVAIAADALISRQSAAAATIWASRYTLPAPAQPIEVSQSRADGRVVPPPTVPTSSPGKRIVACRPPATRRALPCAIDEL